MHPRQERQSDAIAHRSGHRQTKPPARLADHEVDGLGGDFLRGDDDVAFVLPVLVVHENDHPPGADFLDRFFDGTKAFVRMGMSHDGSLSAIIAWPAYPPAFDLHPPGSDNPGTRPERPSLFGPYGNPSRWSMAHRCLRRRRLDCRARPGVSGSKAHPADRYGDGPASLRRPRP